MVTAAGDKLDVILIPKTTAPRDAWYFDTLLSQLELKLGLDKKIGLEAIIEESAALANVEAIAGCCPRLESLILGFGDLSKSQGIRHDLANDPAAPYPGDIWHYPRWRMIAACRAAGIDAIDGPYLNVRDLETYRREALRAAALGAVGKTALHPNQIEIANSIFGSKPSAQRHRSPQSVGRRDAD